MISSGSRLSCAATIFLVLQGSSSFQYSRLPDNVRVDAYKLLSLQAKTAHKELVSAPSSSLATGALVSTGIARRIRKSRSNRGRVAVPAQEPITKKAEPKNRSLLKKRDVTESEKHSSPESKRTHRAKGSHLPYESTVQALKTYYLLHGDLAILPRYIVPESEEYPTEWHGKDLAGTVYDMKWWQRHVKQNPDRVAELNELGFVWERLQPVWNLVLEALITYSSINGHLLVPISFIVPHGDRQYPEATWGIQLGRYAYRIRSRGDFLQGSNSASRRAQLDGLGFVWEVNGHRFRKFYAALRHFAKLERLESPAYAGSFRVLRVPSTFVVPEGEENGWPKELWGFPLGVKCSAVRQKQLYVKNYPERQAALEQIGFQWSGNAVLGWLEVVHAAAIYSKMNNRVLDVPYHFVVPAPPKVSPDNDELHDSIVGSDDAWPWPEQLWGLPLGQRLKDIRLKGAYLNGTTANARRAQLDALGFNWTPKRGRRKKAVDGALS